MIYPKPCCVETMHRVGIAPRETCVIIYTQRKLCTTNKNKVQLYAKNFKKQTSALKVIIVHINTPK